MPVRKHYGYHGCKEISPIVRKPFLGDPAEMPYEHDPKPTSARGKRRSARTDEYMKNLNKRQSQNHPCGPTRDEHRGPHSRPKGLDNKEYRTKMLAKYEWEC